MTSYTYSNTGTYRAGLRVTDDQNNHAMDYITIEAKAVGNPTAIASADQTSGDPVLQVQFTGSGTDLDGTVVLYEWDFDGDGVYDWNSTQNGNVLYSYERSGTFYATFRVTDNDGLTDLTEIPITINFGISAYRSAEDFDSYPGANNVDKFYYNRRCKNYRANYR